MILDSHLRGNTPCAAGAPMRMKVWILHHNPPPGVGEGTGGGDFLGNDGIGSDFDVTLMSHRIEVDSNTPKA